MINPAPVFLPIFGPLGPSVGPGSLGTGSGSQKYCRLRPRSAPGASSKARAWVRCVFGADRKQITKINDTCEAPQVPL